MVNEHWEKIIDGKIENAKKRGSKKRGWIKLDKAWLTSSINYRMELGEIAVFSKLIVMADEFGPVPGLISDNDFRPMPHEYLAHQACCPLDVLNQTIEKGITDDSIYENDHGIFLTHFDDYQFTEYDRQKPYRGRKRENPTLTFKDYKAELKKEFSEIDIEEEYKKFVLWWGEGRKPLKRPKLAFRNWLVKARQIKKEREDGTYKQGAGGATKQYTDPEELRHEVELDE